MNDLQALMNTLIMPAALPVLRENCTMSALIATDFSDAVFEKNQTIRVPLPADLGQADDFNQNTGSTSTDLIVPRVDISLDKWKYKQFEMTDREMAEAVTHGVLPTAAQAAVKSVANSVDMTIWDLYRDVPYYSGSAGVTPNTIDHISQTRRVMQNNLCPVQDRKLVLDTTAETEFINIFSDFAKSGTTEVLRLGSLGTRIGFDIFADQLSPVHHFGQFPAPKLLFAIPGSSVISVTGGVGAETLNHGDVFTVDGLARHNVPVQFVVRKSAIAVLGEIQDLQIYPAIPAWVNIAGLGPMPNIRLVKPAAVGLNHYNISLGFHRDAFLFAARALQKSDDISESSTISIATDPLTGIPLRLETWRDQKLSKRFWRFDILFGVSCLRPELVCRLHG